MSTESNKNVIREMLQVFERGESVSIDKYFATNWVNHDPSLPPLSGHEGAKQLIGMWSAFSNLKVTVEDSIGEAENHEVLYGLLAKPVVDPVDLLFPKSPSHFTLKGDGRGEVVPERLFNDDTRKLGRPGSWGVDQPVSF